MVDRPDADTLVFSLTEDGVSLAGAGDPVGEERRVYAVENLLEIGEYYSLKDLVIRGGFTEDTVEDVLFLFFFNGTILRVHHVQYFLIFWV